MKSYENKRIGACIELHNNNHGSMLQSYATQCMLRDYKLEFDLIAYKKKYTPLLIIKSLPRLLNKTLWQDKLHAIKKNRFIKKHPEIYSEVKIRNDAFKAFRKQYFVKKETTYTGYKELKKQAENYDAFLTGSDQLWSPSGLPTNFYNLMFAPDNKTKISYASSFGGKEIPWYQWGRTKKYLNRLQFISCRENSGAEMVEKLIGKKAPVVCDPTLLYSAEEWNEMIKCDRVVEGEYIFAYFLSFDKEPRQEVMKLKEKTGLKVVSIHQFSQADMNFGDVSVIDAGPDKFFNLIKNATYICTDSFHGTIFSILFHKKFVTFKRYKEDDKMSKNTRIDSLFTNLGLISQKYDGDIISNVMVDINYDAVEEKITAMRKVSRDYIEKAFDTIA